MTLSEIVKEQVELDLRTKALKKEAAYILGAKVIGIYGSWLSVEEPIPDMDKETIDSESGYFDKHEIVVDGISVIYFSDYRSEP